MINSPFRWISINFQSTITRNIHRIPHSRKHFLYQRTTHIETMTLSFKPVSHRTRLGTRFQYGILGYTRVDWYEYWAPTVTGDELVRFRLECSTCMYEQSTDILGQARFVTVWTRFANDFHTIVVRFQVRSSTVCYGLVQLNTTFTRLTGHLQGLHTVPSTFVRVMLELSHICVCFDINWLVLMAWLHKFSNFQQKSYKNGRWQNKGIRNHDKTDRHWDYFGQKAQGEWAQPCQYRI